MDSSRSWSASRDRQACPPTSAKARIAGPGVHRLDAARLYRLALEAGATDPVFHAVADEGVPFREIASAIGRHLGLPVESRTREHFGWFAEFAGADMPASSARTRTRLGWAPTGPGLLDDLDEPAYYAAID